MLNLLNKAEEDIQSLSEIQAVTLPQNRAVRLVTGGILLFGSMRGNKPAGLIGNVSKIVGGAFVLYGLTGWDPLKLNRKAVKAAH